MGNKKSKPDVGKRDPFIPVVQIKRVSTRDSYHRDPSSGDEVAKEVSASSVSLSQQSGHTSLNESRKGCLDVRQPQNSKGYNNTIQTQSCYHPDSSVYISNSVQHLPTQSQSIKLSSKKTEVQQPRTVHRVDNNCIRTATNLPSTSDSYSCKELYKIPNKTIKPTSVQLKSTTLDVSGNININDHMHNKRINHVASNISLPRNRDCSLDENREFSLDVGVRQSRNLDHILNLTSTNLPSTDRNSLNEFYKKQNKVIKPTSSQLTITESVTSQNLEDIPKHHAFDLSRHIYKVDRNTKKNNIYPPTGDLNNEIILDKNPPDVTYYEEQKSDTRFHGNRTYASTFHCGTITNIDRDKDPAFGFIRPDETLKYSSLQVRDVYFKLCNIQSGGMPLEVGDKIEFGIQSLSVKNQNNPVGFKIRPMQLKARSAKHIEAYLRTCVHKLQNDNSALFSNETVLDMVTCQAVWKCIGQTKHLSDNGFQLLMRLIDILQRSSVCLMENFKKVVEELVNTELFNPWKGGLREYVMKTANMMHLDNLLKIQQFLLTIIKYVPKKCRAVVMIAKPLVSNGFGIENMLFSLLDQASKSSQKRIEDMEWDELPLVPSPTELLHEALDSNLRLQPVIIKGKYDSPQEYVDTYFRLLRADCFDKIIKGIRDLMKGKLDPRDMNVYRNIKLAGIIITQSENVISLGIKLTPQTKVTNWETASNLSFGNLVCISASGTFQDVIWATVGDRKLLASKQIVLLELCSECNDISDAEAVKMLELSGGSAGLMVESPTYYRAYQPVLKALQRLDPDSMPFVNELIHVEKSTPSTFINMETSFNGTIVNVNLTNTVSVDNFCLQETSIHVNRSLDISQEKAIKHSLINRIAIVQGPPGTGKTFIGIKLMQILVSLEPQPKLPILVLTYKNHALDEFLKSMLTYFPDKVVRVGGQCKDPDLEECNLNKMRRKYNMPKLLYQEIRNYRDEMDLLKGKLKSTLYELKQCKKLSLQSFRQFLSKTQVNNLLLSCDWKNVKMPSLLYKTQNEDFTQIFMDTDEVLQILEMVNMNIEEYINKEGPTSDGNIKTYLDQMVVSALEQWIPDKKTFDVVLRQGLLGGIQLSTVQALKEKESVLDLYDAKDVDELEKERAAAVTTGFKSKEELLKEMVIMYDEEKKSKNGMPSLASNAKKIIKDLPSTYLSTNNLWDLPEQERVLFIQAYLHKVYEEKGIVFQDMLEDYQNVCSQKNRIEISHKVSILESMTVVGMTITGASIHQELLSRLKPVIIVVEEAAEVLEPQLLATIGNWCKQLIMIGDHKQLRPTVESYELAKDFHLDVSMMERLINNKLDYASLETQNRMRPEFAKLLIDIYPNLKSSHRVNNNIPPNCILFPMFFWDHNDKETSGRSYTNVEEADRAIKLALFLIQQNYEPCKVTILGAYQGQVRLLRQKMREAETAYKSIFDLYKEKSIEPTEQKNKDDNNDDEEEKSQKMVKIQTIDNYQGDENEVVIVSLVRSNDKKKIGFLNTSNRRCVAQSRAKSGMYFIGSQDTLLQSPHWKNLIDGMRKAGCIGEYLPLHCPRHTSIQLFVRKASDITLGTFCQQKCMQVMHCKQHYCSRKCQPTHSHLLCYVEVSFTFEDCSHSRSKKCFESVDKFKCEQLVPFTFPECNHTTKRKCSKNVEDMQCFEKCIKRIECTHPCENWCYESCDTKETCKECDRIRKEEERLRQLAEKKDIKRKKDEIEQAMREINKYPVNAQVSRRELKPYGESSSEFNDVKDLVEKYIQTGHKWNPVVTKIEKITNNSLKSKWLETQKRMIDPRYVSRKFHGTSTTAVEAIIHEGFLMPSQGGMYGAGIYFATDSSKSAQEIYTHGSNSLLLCSVILGKTYTVNKGQRGMDFRKLRGLGYDSVYAKRGTKSSGGVLYDEYIVYNPSQAIVDYIIYYGTEKVKSARVGNYSQIEAQALQKNKTTKHQILPKRELELTDELDVHFRIAESQFLRLIGHRKYAGNAEIVSVEYVINPKLFSNFMNKVNEFEVKYKSVTDDSLKGYVLAFHGTSEENIDGIVENNFLLQKLASNTGNRGHYGAGIYFSEFPDVSVGYGRGSGSKKLLLCKVLPGKSYDVNTLMMGSSCQAGYDSHRVNKDVDGRGHELVIFNPDQILPCYVLNLSE